MTLTFGSLLAIAAFLVFWVQPLVARMILPVLGGSPGVWNTCVFFFQTTLLLGYLYAHFLTRLKFSRQRILHGAALTVALILAPNTQSAWTSNRYGAEALDILLGLTSYIGVPFIVLSSSAPLLQHWYSLSRTERAADPFFLYAASNAGSLLALLIFPTLLEQFLPLTDQIAYWFYMVLGFSITVAVLSLILPTTAAKTTGQPSATFAVQDRWQAAAWVGTAFVPSSLMLSVTTHITTDIAAVSFLWIVPLAIFLSTYILAFSGLGKAAASVARLALPLSILGLWVVLLQGRNETLVQIPIDLGIVACVSMLLHHQLFQARPEAERLTSFYICIAIGGLFGGLFNSLVAPALFDSVLEFELVLGIGVLVVNWNLINETVCRFRNADWRGLGLRDVGLIIFAAFAFAVIGLEFNDASKTLLVTAMVACSAIGCAYIVGVRGAGQLIATLSAALFLSMSMVTKSTHGLFAERSFFGALTVDEIVVEGRLFRRLIHGTTIHGIQSQEAGEAMSLQSYYAPMGPVIASYTRDRASSHIGIMGLGTGNIACAARNGDRVTFFEIDKAVYDVAREYFSYLDSCPADTDVVIGDARMSLENIGDAAFDVLILDVFSSDSVPIHLLTIEAMRLYQRMLADDGILIAHISNRYLELKPVIARSMEELGWEARILSGFQESPDVYATPSEYIVAAATTTGLGFLNDLDSVTELAGAPDFALWTDDFSSVISVLVW